MQALPFISLLTRSASSEAASPFGWPCAATTWLNLMTISPGSHSAAWAMADVAVRPSASTETAPRSRFFMGS